MSYDGEDMTLLVWKQAEHQAAWFRQDSWENPQGYFNFDRQTAESMPLHLKASHNITLGERATGKQDVYGETDKSFSQAFKRGHPS